MYYNGRGVMQDYYQALKWFRKAAEQGEARAQKYLGVMHKFGQSIPQNYEESVMWYRKSSEQGNIHAQLLLGDMYRLGYGVRQNYVKAHKWYNLAGTMGHYKGVKEREEIAKQMNSSQISRAHRLAWKWMKKHQQKVIP